MLKQVYSLLIIGALLIGFTACESKSNGGGGGGGGGFTSSTEAVDLGLPSGTKWAKCNLGAKNPEDAGYYYAWGETATKSKYDWSTYKYGKYDEYDSPNYGLTKYNNTDGLTTLEKGDDAATSLLGNDWYIPTADDVQELITYCTWVDAVQNDVPGYTVTGQNGNSIFLPCTSCQFGDMIHDINEYGKYWTSTTNFNSGFADALFVESDYGVLSRGTDTLSRCYGCPIRPVTQKSTSNNGGNNGSSEISKDFLVGTWEFTFMDIFLSQNGTVLVEQSMKASNLYLNFYSNSTYEFTGNFPDDIIMDSELFKSGNFSLKNNNTILSLNGFYDVQIKALSNDEINIVEEVAANGLCSNSSFTLERR